MIPFSNLIKLLIVLSILAVLPAFAQKYCTDCYKYDQILSRWNYTCNGQKCEAFYWPVEKFFQNYPGLQCRPYSPGHTSYVCYYSDGFDSAVGKYKFVACNYSLPYCGTCYKKDYCQNCYWGAGYYYDFTNPELNVKKCRPCLEAIPGCDWCSDAYECIGCKFPYILIKGICYEQDGKTIAGKGNGGNDGGDWISGGGSAETIEAIGIAALVFLIILNIVVVLGLCLWTRKQKYGALLQNAS